MFLKATILILYLSLQVTDMFTWFGLFCIPFIKITSSWSSLVSFSERKKSFLRFSCFPDYWLWTFIYWRCIMTLGHTSFFSVYGLPWLVWAPPLYFQENLGLCDTGPDVQVPQPPFSHCWTPCTWGTAPSPRVSLSPVTTDFLCYHQESKVTTPAHSNGTLSTCPPSFPGSRDCLFSVTALLT